MTDVDYLKLHGSNWTHMLSIMDPENRLSELESHREAETKTGHAGSTVYNSSPLKGHTIWSGEFTGPDSSGIGNILYHKNPFSNIKLAISL